MKSTKASTLTSEILVVEDSPTQQEQVRHLLEGHGFSVRAVCNGKEALEHMRKHQPALVISDVVMPEMDGYALCGEMKSHASLKDIPVILLTSLSGPEDIIKGLQCGADNFIKKPFDERYLLSRVEYILVNRRLRKSDKLQMGVELYLGGQKHFITAERQQILDLLISTYDQAVRLNEELQSREKEIDRANLILRGLYQIAKRLNQAATEQELVEQVLDRALELPGFKAGWIALAEGEACFPVAAVRGVPLDHKETGVLDGMCLCRRKLLSGELQRTTIIPDCERLAKMDGDALGQRLHVSIPLLINDRAIGIMNLVVSGQLTFGDDDIQTFNGIGNQIGVALERVRMREHLEQLVQERTAALTAEIAERKRAEEQLRLLAHTIRSVSDCITVTDTEERLIFVNDAFLKTYGYTEAEVLGRDIGLVRSPNNDPALTATIHPGTLAGGWQGELLNRRKDGTEFTVHLISSVVRDERGEVVAMVGVARDISEQRRAKDALQRERSLLRTLIDNLPDAIYVKDSACRTTIANVADVRWMGRQSEAEVLQKSDFDFYPADIAAAYYAADQSVIQTGTPVLNKEESLLDKEGKTHFFSTSKLPLRDERGQIIGLVGVGREVTEQKRAEDALRHEKALMDALMDNIPDSIYFKDRQCRLVRINRKMMQSLNLDEMSQAIAKTDVELYGEEFGRKTLAIDQQLMESGEPIIGLVETRQLQDGQINWTSTTKVPLRDNGGQVVGLVGITREINELMRAQEEREHERSLLRTLIDNLPDYIYVKDTEGRFVVANRAVVRQLGFASEGELVGKSDFDLFPRELAARNYADEQTIIQSGQGLYNYEGPTVDANKEEKDRWVSTTKVPLRDGQGKITGFVGIGRDITGRKRSEAALFESERKYRGIFENIQDVYYETTLDGTILEISPSIEAVSAGQYKRADLIGKSMYEFYPDERERQTLLAALQQRSSVTDYEITLRNRDGSLIPCSISAKVQGDPQGHPATIIGSLRSITERKIAEQDLERERNLLRTLIDAIPDEIAVKDVERRFLVVNPATVRALNRASADEIIGKRDEDFIAEHLVEDVKWEESAVLAVGGHSRNRVADKIDPETGEIEQSLLVSKIPLKDHEGKIIGLVGINRDITELKQAHEMLEKERTLLLTLIESIPDEVCLKDLRHRYLVANGALIMALGATSLEALIGKTDQDFVPPALAQQHFAEEEAIVGSGEPIINREETKLNPDTGEIEKCALTTKVPVRDQTGKTIGILVVNRDITGRKRAEEALRSSEEKFRALFEESKDCIYISSADGKLLDINAAGVEMFGYDSREELLRMDLGSDLYVDSQRREQFLSQMNQQGFVKDFEAVLKRKDGGKLIVLETATAVQDKQGNVVMYRGTIRDVTKQRQLERQVIQAQKMESLGLLAGGIAHDFNNILGIILGHTAIIERAGKEPAVLKDSANEITTAVQRGANLVRQILTFARKADATAEPVNVNVIIRELSKMIGDTFPKTIALSLDLGKSIPIIMMDQTQLHQALLNLCVNARDAITDPSAGKLGRGELKIKTRVVEGGEVRKKFSEASAAEYICISVSDSGMGMDDVTKQHIFEPFFTTKEMGKGTGLGLSVVYGIIKAHHGHIEVESEVGNGTTFSAYLPVTGVAASPAAQVEAGSEKTPGGTETILLVEDEQNLLALMKSMLERAGYTVLTATDGMGAIKVFSLNKERIALVLTDIGLPKLDGVAVVTSIMEIDPSVRVILASGYLEPNLKSNLLRAGAKDFVQKPYNPHVVLRKIREVLDGSS